MKHTARFSPKRLLALSLVLALALGLMSLSAFAENTFSADANPVILSSSDDLNAFRASLSGSDYTGKTVQLAGNIAYTGGDTAGGFLPFQGTFDGQGFSITGFTDNHSGLFEAIGPQGKVTRLHLNMNAANIGVPLYGAIAGTSQGAVSECRISGLMQSGMNPGEVAIGGLVGRLQDDEANPGAMISNCIMEAAIQPQDGGATLTAYGAASTTDNQRLYAVLVLGEVDGDTVYGLSDKGASRSGGQPSYFDNTMTSASFEDQYSPAKTYDELCDMSLYTSAGFDQNIWLLRAGELPLLAAFNAVGAYAEAAEDTEEAASDTGPSDSSNSSNSSGSSGSTSQTVSVKSVTLANTALTLKVGETATLKYTLSPSNATNRRVSWTTTTPAVATVDSKGVVTAVAPGKTGITITTNSKGRTALCEVTVVEAAPATPAITLSASSLSGSVGQTQSLKATLAPTLDAATITWASSATDVATITPGATALEVTVGLLKEGTSTITATVNGTTYAASCSVTVTGSVPVTGVTLNQNSMGLTKGGSGQLVATILPDNASNRNVTWSTNDASIATVSGGTVTGVGGGTTVITATTADGAFSAACQVTVTDPNATTPPTTPPTTLPETTPPEGTGGDGTTGGDSTGGTGNTEGTGGTDSTGGTDGGGSGEGGA